MGYYVNPPTMSKEFWLAQNGTLTGGPCEITPLELPVCLVNNGMFRAAGVGVSPSEVEAFNQPNDPRDRVWFKVPREALVKIGAIPANI